MISRKRLILCTLGAAAALAFVLTQTAGSNRQYKLGGAWVGGSGGAIINAFHAPLDPEGRTMAGRVHFVTWNADSAALFSSLGADTLSDFVGQSEMISRDTAKWRLVGYALKQGNPPAIQGIVVSQGTGKYTSPDSMVFTYNVYVYLPSADADGDGFPDADSTPVVTIPNVIDTIQRVLPPSFEK